MKEPTVLACEFVKAIPARLEERTLYVSMDYATVSHKCCCGCGLEVVTPLSPTDWKLSYDGRGVSLHPSIGNWSFACQSHYWIKEGKAIWAGAMSKDQIDSVRSYDRIAKRRHYDGGATAKEATPPTPARKKGFWDWLFGSSDSGI